MPVRLSTVTEKPLPVIRTSWSRSSWRSAGTLARRAGVTAGAPVSTGSCCRATSKPAFAHGVGSLVVKEEAAGSTRCPGRGRREGVGDGDVLARPRCHVQLLPGQLPAPYHLAVGDEFPVAVELPEAGEEVLVGEGDGAGAPAGGAGGVDRLVDALDLGGLAGVAAVGGDDAVRDEGAVVGVVAPVSAVGEEGLVPGPLPLGLHGGGVEPEPHAVVAGAAALGCQFGGGEGAGVHAGAPDGAAELPYLVVGVSGEREGRGVAAGAPVGGPGGPFDAVDVEGQGPGVRVEDAREVVLAAGPVVRRGPVRGDPLACGVDEELQGTVVLQRVLGVALGEDRLVVARHVRGDPGLQGQGTREVQAVVALEDGDAGQALVAVEGAAGGEDLAAQPGGPGLGEQGAGGDGRVEGLVHEVPDPAALEHVVPADDVPVLLEVEVRGRLNARCCDSSCRGGGSQLPVTRRLLSHGSP
ncbi:hypothetical protein STENM36S_03831 [Streptomyces tendae]